MADTRVSKTRDRKVVWVQLPPPVFFSIVCPARRIFSAEIRHPTFTVECTMAKGRAGSIPSLGISPLWGSKGSLTALSLL